MADERNGRVITPHRAAAERRALRAWLAELRATLRRVRALRATGRQLAAEEAEGLLVMAHHDRQALRAARARLAASTVTKYSNVSPAAEARLRARRA